MSEDMPWIHLDISGVSMYVPDKPYFRSYGATGFVVRFLTEFLTNNTYIDKLKSMESKED